MFDGGGRADVRLLVEYPPLALTRGYLSVFVCALSVFVCALGLISAVERKAARSLGNIFWGGRFRKTSRPAARWRRQGFSFAAVNCRAKMCRIAWWYQKASKWVSQDLCWMAWMHFGHFVTGHVVRCVRQRSRGADVSWTAAHSWASKHVPRGRSHEARAAQG